MSGTTETHPYTCLSCSLAFTTAASQREHYATDLHRYNSKRRVAGLQPVTAQTFNDKVVERVVQQADDAAAPLKCKACNKTFATQATQQTHELSKKHKEAVLKAAAAIKADSLTSSPVASSSTAPAVEDVEMAPAASSSSSSTPAASTSTSTPADTAAPVVDFESSGDAKLDLLVARRIQTAPPIPTTTCLFCPVTSATPQDNVTHMRHAHSFAIPEDEYLVDLDGLLKRLGEEVGTWNVCICCGKGYGGNINLETESMSQEELKRRASKGIEGVRAHMQGKSHCRIAYDTESQRLDLADFYDFRPSYPDYAAKQERKAARKAAKAAASEWEDEDVAEGDADEAEDGMEVVYEEVSDDESSDEDSDDEDLPTSDITYGDTSYELVLPSGARIGHRAHRTLHKQNLVNYLEGTPFKASAHSSPNSTFKPSPHSQMLLKLVPKAQKGPNGGYQRPLHEAGLIPAKGAGRGGNGDVIKARNKGEAKEAGKAVRTFKEVRAFQEQANIRGQRGNNQKHFRDFLLQ
ncbi:zinc finger protein 622 [Pseudohyphozyma bogoriensis]|nr:zinc finger protein 622 [Pseudohyphozyma bogoriensis]